MNEELLEHGYLIRMLAAEAVLLILATALATAIAVDSVRHR